jgi:hypothetical protein
MDYIYNFLITIISLIVFYLFKSYWPKYFEAKGTNQATKEDIGEITEIVETIKSDLIQQNELLRAQLSLNNQHILNLKTAEREAIFEFNKQLSAWLYSVVRFSFSAYNQDNFKDLKLKSADFSKRQYECDLAEAHLTLFMNDQEFLNLKRDLIVAIINFQADTEELMHKVYHQYSKCEFDLGLEDTLAKQSEIIAKSNKQINLLTNQYLDNMPVQYKEVHIINIKMRELLNKKLEQLENKL